jgi:transcriptional regulator with XRE-family HTH domain
MKLGAYLELQKITLEAFGKTIGRTRQAVSRYVADERMPDRDTMAKIVTATQGAVTANDFYSPASKRAA